MFTLGTLFKVMPLSVVVSGTDRSLVVTGDETDRNFLSLAVLFVPMVDELTVRSFECASVDFVDIDDSVQRELWIQQVGVGIVLEFARELVLWWHLLEEEDHLLEQVAVDLFFRRVAVGEQIFYGDVVCVEQVARAGDRHVDVFAGYEARLDEFCAELVQNFQVLNELALALDDFPHNFGPRVVYLQLVGDFCSVELGLEVQHQIDRVDHLEQTVCIVGKHAGDGKQLVVADVEVLFARTQKLVHTHLAHSQVVGRNKLYLVFRAQTVEDQTQWSTLLEQHHQRGDRVVAGLRRQYSCAKGEQCAVPEAQQGL
ncbi:hypothetical protein OGAPHI_007317 [Ogataea philodendri]|uniref:Uncharacterized protein n=1 Tax=Ogataea philodendri TaxID=1378263 RepID=A0A9P8NVF7_9ASCO|nr:uncharacterized protein OGAPHI_007317 [Ogataea philodendri]KAH3660112.1 hypothetical protein OGAPHI_007317 [Ogataea philodendri]